MSCAAWSTRRLPALVCASHPGLDPLMDTMPFERRHHRQEACEGTPLQAS
jgi:hypothetical protein